MKQRWNKKLAETVLAEQSASGLSKKDFCSRRGINVATFYVWQRRLRDSGQQLGFTKLQVSVSSDLEVRLPGGTCLSLAMGDVGLMADLLYAIDQRYA